MTTTIQKEAFSSELAKEILPLAQSCWQESTLNKGETCSYHGERDFQIEPNLEVYERFSAAECLVIFTIREEAILKGYVIVFIYRSWHQQNILCASVDSMYVQPSHRSFSPVMTERLEQDLKYFGVQIIGWVTHINGPVYEFLKSMGYVGDDMVMEKRLK